MSPPAVVKIEKKIRKGTFKALVNQIAWERLQNGPTRYVNLFIMKSLPCCITGYSFWLRVKEFFESLLFRLTPPGKQSTTASILPQPSLFWKKEKSWKFIAAEWADKVSEHPFVLIYDFQSGFLLYEQEWRSIELFLEAQNLFSMLHFKKNRSSTLLCLPKRSIFRHGL